MFDVGAPGNNNNSNLIKIQSVWIAFRVSDEETSQTKGSNLGSKQEFSFSAVLFPQSGSDGVNDSLRTEVIFQEPDCLCGRTAKEIRKYPAEKLIWVDADS